MKTSRSLPPPIDRPTRRDALRAGVLCLPAVAGASAAVFAAEEDKTERPAGDIDAHVHVWTPNTREYPLAEGYSKEDMQPKSFTPQQLFDHARPNGIGRIVLIQMSFYGDDNSYMLDAMRNHKGVFSGVAVIDEKSESARTMKQLKEHGVRGFRIRPRKLSPDKWLASEGMAEMWKCGAVENLNMCCLIDAEFVPSVDAMCRRFADTPVVIDHFARIGIDGEIREKDLANLCKLAKHKQVTVKVSAFYALGKKKSPYTDLLPMIHRLLDAFGPERLMWATDCPYQVQGNHTYKDSVALIRDRLDKLSGDDRAWLLRKTAEKVFFS